jgi:hypothetical protein
MRSKLLFVAVVSASLVSTSVFAHDPSLHEDKSQKNLPKATTCKQLADTERYSADFTDPAVKALKAKCDAEKKAEKSTPAKKN